MAAAEARAAWQRAANRCFVQEDAKRAPKLACCPPSSSSKPQFDAGPGDTASGPDHPTTGFMPLNWNPSNSNLPPDTKWWLQLQPNFGYMKDLTREQLNALEAEMEVLRAGALDQTSKLSGEHPPGEEESTHVDTYKNAKSSLDPQWRVSATCMNHDPEVRVQELKAVNGNNTEKPLKHKDTEEYWHQDEELMDLDPVDGLISNQSKRLWFDLGSPWMGGEKTEPWWRTADKDELAYLVAQKSLEHIENCDLPRPQATHIRRDPFSCVECFDHDGFFTSSLDWKAHTGVFNPTDNALGSPISRSINGNLWASGEVRHSLYGSEKQFSSKNSYSTTNKDTTETWCTTESEPSNAQLLEALCHSQTRAREAEKAAQQAHTEKEHIIKLFFRQASHLFAYKQWFQLLQLETLFLQLKSKDQPISNLFPVVLPWMPYKGRQLRKGRHKAAKGRQNPPRYDISKYAVAFAVGLSLAGAGLLLGWTMGWLLPTF